MNSELETLQDELKEKLKAKVGVDYSELERYMAVIQAAIFDLNASRLKEPTIVIPFESAETLKSFPPVFVKCFEDAVMANADNEDYLEYLKTRAINIRAVVDNAKSALYEKKMGWKPVQRNEIGEIMPGGMGL